MSSASYRSVFIAILFSQLMGIQTPAAPATNASADGQIIFAVDALMKCPSWSEADPKTNEMIAVFKGLSRYKSEVLRQAIYQFVERCKAEKNYDIASMSKLFVLNRYVFRVPSKEKFGGPFFGGWDGVPHTNDEMNVLWPLSLVPSGELVLTGKYSGYAGEPYNAVAEFDFFQKKYGRRGLPPKPVGSQLQK